MTSLNSLHEENTTGLREFTSYPVDFQVKDFPLDYGTTIIRAVSNAFFFTKFTDENGNRNISANSSNLEELAHNVVLAYLDKGKVPEVVLQVDSEVFSNPENMGQKYKHLRDEPDEVAAQQIAKECGIVKDSVENPDFMPTLFKKVLDTLKTAGKDINTEELLPLFANAIKVQGVQMDEPIQTPSWSLSDPYQEGAEQIHSVQWAGKGLHSEKRVQIIGYPEKILEQYQTETQNLTRILKQHGFLTSEQTLEQLPLNESKLLQLSTSLNPDERRLLQKTAERAAMFEAATILPQQSLSQAKGQSVDVTPPAQAGIISKLNALLGKLENMSLYNLHENEQTSGVRVFEKYPADFQLADFPKDYANSTITNIDAAFFFCKAEAKDGKTTIVDEDKHLVQLAKNIIEATTDEYKPKVTFVVDETLVKDAEAFAKKYANRRPEYDAQKPETAEQIMRDEAQNISAKLTNPEYMASVFAKAAAELGQNAEEAQKTALTKKAEELAKENAITFQLGKMPEKGLEYPTWVLTTPREAGKPDLHGTQFTPPQTDKSSRPWVIGHPEKLKERFTEQHDAFLNSLTEEQISKEAKEAKDLSQVNTEKLSAEQKKELTVLNTMNPENIANANKMRESSAPAIAADEKSKDKEGKKGKKIFAIVGGVLAVVLAVVVGKNLMGGKDEPQQKLAAGGQGR